MALAIFAASSFNGCLASEARQAEGIGWGAVVKPRTPQGLSTGLSCGQVVCPPRARSRSRRNAGRGFLQSVAFPLEFEQG